MCTEQKFFKCNICGNIAGMIYFSGAIPVCCKEEMHELVANTVDASKEKHLPVVTVNGNEVSVTVGQVIHPSLKEHHIDWIYLQTCCGGHRKCIEIGKEPVAKYILSEGEKAEAVYAYCNLHGLWKTEIK